MPYPDKKSGQALGRSPDVVNIKEKLVPIAIGIIVVGRRAATERIMAEDSQPMKDRTLSCSKFDKEVQTSSLLALSQSRAKLWSV